MVFFEGFFYGSPPYAENDDVGAYCIRLMIRTQMQKVNMKNLKFTSFWLMLIMGISTVAAQTTTLPLNVTLLESGHTRLSSTVPGELSGSVTSRSFEYRLKGATTWTAIEADAFFLANLPHLPSGLYEFRAVAVISGLGTPLYSEVYDMQITCFHCDVPSIDPCAELPAPTIENGDQLPCSSESRDFLFCKSDNTTVADLKAKITGTSIKIYGQGNNLLENSALLETGTYYATQTVGDCESSKLELTLTVCDCPQIVINSQYNMFTKNPCGCDAGLNTAIGFQAGMTKGPSTFFADNIQIPGSGHISYDVYYLHNGAVGRITVPTLIEKWVKSTESVPSTAVLPAEGFGKMGFWWYKAEGATPFTITLRCCAPADCPPLEPTVSESISLSLSAGATIADLKAEIEGGNIKIYRQYIAETPLEDSELLETGKYLAGQTTGTPPCDNVSKLINITVTVICETLAPVIENGDQLPCSSEIRDFFFCSSDNATVTDLIARITGTSIKIYGQENNLLESSALLETGTYYATQTEGSCESSKLELTLSVCHCPQILIQPGGNTFMDNPCGCDVGINTAIGFQAGMKKGANASVGDNILIPAVSNTGVYEVLFLHNGTVGKTTNPALDEKWVASGATTPTPLLLSASGFYRPGYWQYISRATEPFTITLRCCAQNTCPPLEKTDFKGIILPFNAGTTIADLKAEVESRNVEISKEYFGGTPLADSELLEIGRYYTGQTTGTPLCDYVSKLMTIAVLNTPVDASIESGETHTFKDAEGSSLAPIPNNTLTNVAYKWEVCTANCGTPSAVWANAPGTNNQAGYTTEALTNDTYFRRTVSANGVNPLVTEVLVEVTVEVAPARDYYYEFPGRVCAEDFEVTVAWYYPEIPTPADWLDRVGTVQMLPHQKLNVRLIDETGIDGIAKARVVLDNGAIPATWARALAYPTFINLWKVTPDTLPHPGNADTLIIICTP